MPIDRETVSKGSPPSDVVTDFHRYADTDSRVEAIHHTLGNLHSQGAYGDHNHRDGNGRALLEDVTLTGSVSLNTASVLDQVCAALALLGAVDSTSS